MSAVATIQTDKPVAQPQEAVSLLAVISRAAADPSVDIDKMERLMQMHERMQAKQAEAEFAADLAAMQCKLPSIGERGKADRYKFALWEDINAAIKPVLTEFGFALSFRTDFTDGIAVTGVLTHRSGHREQTTIKLPADTSGNKNAVQAVASSVSYGKRYTAGALLNLTSHGEDDDAFASGATYDITPWRDAIASAVDKAGLEKLATKLKAAEDIPPTAMKNIRALWAARAKEVK